MIYRSVDELETMTEDINEQWVCPVCGSVNNGKYYSHSVTCPTCGQFILPPINTSNDILIDMWKKEIQEAKEQIQVLRSEIEYYENCVVEYENKIMMMEKYNEI